MPRSFLFLNSPRRLWWLMLMLLIGGCTRQTFSVAPRQQTRAPRRSVRRSSTPRAGTSRNTSSRRAAPHETVAGGQLLTDVVTRVHDGDTVTLQRLGSIRLIGIDCPELKQQGGEEAGDFARHALLNKTVQVELCAKQPYDRYGRGLGRIYVNDARGQRVLFNSEMVRAGYARVYSLRPCTVDEAEWGGYYEEARTARRGLFASLGEVPDAATFRHSKR